jgi:hypothetical protein
MRVRKDIYIRGLLVRARMELEVKHFRRLYGGNRGESIQSREQRYNTRGKMGCVN